MSNRFVVSVCALAALTLVGWLAVVALSGQTSTPSAATGSATAKAKPWTPPRTADGQPDLQGTWTNATNTPLERPAALAGKEFFTEVEALEARKRVSERYRSQSKEDIHYDNALWLGTDPTRAARAPLNLRTSLIVDPPDGRIPPLTPEARKRVADRALYIGKDGIDRNSADGPESRTIMERCIMWLHEGPPMRPQGASGPDVDYNANYQILQTPGYVTIIQEMIHDVRIIPLDGRPHLSRNLRQWFGDSRGRWEGETLVVDTTNFTDKHYFFRGTASPSLDGLHARGADSALRVVERFTRIDADTIRYQFTVDDPTTWTRPWSAEMLMWKTDGLLFEYACHEGNYGISNILRNARAEEKPAQVTKKH